MRGRFNDADDNTTRRYYDNRQNAVDYNRPQRSRSRTRFDRYRVSRFDRSNSREQVDCHYRRGNRDRRQRASPSLSSSGYRRHSDFVPRPRRFRSPRDGRYPPGERWSRDRSPAFGYRSRVSWSPESPRSCRDTSRERPMTNTLMMREIPLELKEAEIREDLLTLGFTITDVRLVRRKDNGCSRGFGFIELISPEEAKKLLDATKGRYMLMNEHSVVLIKSCPRADEDAGRTGSSSKICPSDALKDWDCFRCGMRNFKRRDHCFRCNLTKDDSERGRRIDGSEAVGSELSRTLVLRGLRHCGMSKEDLISRVNIRIVSLNITPCDAFVVNGSDLGNFAARSFAFIEFNDCQQAALALNNMQDKSVETFEIDDCEISVDYCKVDFEMCIAEYTSGDVPFCPKSRLANTACSSGLPMGLPISALSDMNPPTCASLVQITNGGQLLNTSILPLTTQQSLMVMQSGQLVPCWPGFANQQTYSQLNCMSAICPNTSVIVPQQQQPEFQSDRANMGAAVAQAAMRNLHSAKKQQQQHRSDVSRRRSDSRLAEVAESAPSNNPQQVSAAATIATQFAYNNALMQNGMYWNGTQWIVIPMSHCTVTNPVTTSLPETVDATLSTPTTTTTTTNSGEEEKKMVTAEQTTFTGNQTLPNNNSKTKADTARSIAKQMEKWAASVNKQKSKKSHQNCSLQQKSTMPAAASAASAQRQQQVASHYLVSSSSSSSILSSLIEPVAPVSGSVPPDLTIAKLARVPRGLVSSGTGLVAEYSDDSDSNDEGSEQQNFIRKDRPLAEVNVESVRQSPCSDGNNALKTATVCSTDANLIDWVQLICTICRRKFTSEDILKKHIASSQLHKDNMESRLSSKQLQAVTAQSIMAGSGRNQQGRYRDRAKERRQMHCAGDDDAKRRRIASPPSPN